MRTTIRLDESLLREAKVRAAQAGRSLNDFMEEAIRLAVLASGPSYDTPSIPVFTGGRGLRPGVQIDSNAELLDWMENEETPG
ncbi:MAG: ribbon-helix-helix protein, CopG family [Gemmatimonadaceae bacterium]